MEVHRCYSTWPRFAFRVHEAEPGSVHAPAEQAVPSPRVVHHCTVAERIQTTSSRDGPLLLTRREE